MCGFAGFISYAGRGSREVLKGMTDAIVHRGPDDEGHEILTTNHAVIGLGFRRLSIIDLSPAGHQPMFSAGRDVCVMMNGEIYNYKEIRAELEKAGYVFRSHSDTEVVIAAYQQFGIAACSRFIGMFSIVLTDLLRNKVFLLRDRAGVKPLFYHLHPEGVLFGSELKSFHQHPQFSREINLSSVHHYFYYGNIPAPHTIFKDTFKVEPGSYLTFDLETRTVKSHTYWDAFDAYNAGVRSIRYEEAVEETERIMKSAFQYRMVADVPVGVFLSGGYDSTAVAALLRDTVGSLNTFTIGFEERDYDESGYAQQVADQLGTQHHTLRCTMKDALAIIPELPWIYDEPFGDSSAIPTTLVSRLARQQVTVALSADAGDELFGGYPRHLKSSAYIRKMQQVPAPLRKLAAASISSLKSSASLSKANRLEKLVGLLQSQDVVMAFHIINQTYTDGEIRLLTGCTVPPLSHPFQSGNGLSEKVTLLQTLLAVEYKTYLVDDILQKVDRATMSASLEGREPFLDHRLLEWTASLPDEFKIKNGVQKRILKDIVHKYVPKEIMERPKMGFGVPVPRWMKHELRELFEDVVNEQTLKAAGFLDSGSVLKLKSDYLEGKLEDFERMWFVFILLQWHQRWMQ